LEVITKVYPWFPFVFVFGTIVSIIALILIPFLLFNIKRRQKELISSIEELLTNVESIFIKAMPLLDAGTVALSNSKECPDCKKLIDGAYGVCPFCSHEFSKKYYINIIGPGDEVTLNNAAQKLAKLLKIDFHEVKHRLRMGFDYVILDRSKRMELMSGLEKMGCTVKEVVKWV